MYNRYIPQPERYAPVEHRASPPQPPSWSAPKLEKGGELLKGLLQRLHLETLDSGDLLLLLIALLIWKDGDDPDLLLALGAALLLGDGKEQEKGSH